MSGYVRHKNYNQHHRNVQRVSDLALPQQKMIVINDKIGIEPKGTELTSLWLRERYGERPYPTGVNYLKESGEHLLLTISKLERRFEPRQIFKYLALCKRNPAVTHVFVWISEHKLQQTFVLPYLEHMADTVITFEDNKHVSLLVKKQSGAVTNKYYEFESTLESIVVNEVKRPPARQVPPPVEEEPLPNPASLGTFKIGLNDQEVAAKNALTLPFEFYKSTPGGGKILYHPDAEDDLDEEDPDDDLLI